MVLEIGAVDDLTHTVPTDLPANVPVDKAFLSWKEIPLHQIMIR